MKKSFSSLYLISIALFVAALLGGCGSASKTISVPTGGTEGRAAVGSATISIQWPPRTPTRLIPVASNSITVTLSQNGKAVAQQVVARPTTGSSSQVDFPTLPVGSLTVTATATPNSDGTGTPQASGVGTLTVRSNNTTAIGIVMATTIKSLQILPPNTLLLPIGGTAPLDVEALDSKGNIVLISAATVRWSTDNPAVATVTPTPGATGVTVNGIGSGDANVTVFESESKLTASLQVSVRGGLAKIAISAENPQMTVGGTMQFSVYGLDAAGFVIPNLNIAGVTWSSSNSQIAVITPDTGLAQANSTGAGNPATVNVTITATVGGLAAATSTLSVNTAGSTQVLPVLSPSSVTLLRGTQQQFTVYTGQNPTQNVFYFIQDPNNLGAAAVGTIDAFTGVYTAPATVPTTQPITIVAFVGSSQQTATVTIN